MLVKQILEGFNHLLNPEKECLKWKRRPRKMSQWVKICHKKSESGLNPTKHIKLDIVAYTCNPSTPTRGGRRGQKNHWKLKGYQTIATSKSTRDPILSKVWGCEDQHPSLSSNLHICKVTCMHWNSHTYTPSHIGTWSPIQIKDVKT